MLKRAGYRKPQKSRLSKMAGKLILFLTAFVVIAGCGNDPKAKKEKGGSIKGKPKLVFEQEMYNFGDIKEGDVVGKYIHFRNEGTAPLVLSKVIANCGCLDVKYPDKPVRPGEKGKLEVIFDTNGFYGRQVKFVKIFSNDSSSTEKELMIYATVN